MVVLRPKLKWVQSLKTPSDVGVQIMTTAGPHPPLDHTPPGARPHQEAWRPPNGTQASGVDYAASEASPRRWELDRQRGGDRCGRLELLFPLRAAGGAMHRSRSQGSSKFNPPSSTTFLDIPFPPPPPHTHTYTLPTHVLVLTRPLPLIQIRFHPSSEGRDSHQWEQDVSGERAGEGTRATDRWVAHQTLQGTHKVVELTWLARVLNPRDVIRNPKCLFPYEME